jgi:serine/threonine protein kinase
MKTSNSVVVTEMFHDEKMHVAKSNEHSSFGAFVKKVQSLEPDQPNAKRPEMSASSQPAATSLSDSRQMTIAQQSMSIEDFSYQRDIGAGSFGRVILVVHQNSRRVLAMKTISKKVLRRKKIAQEEWRLERDVLVKIEAHPYIVELLCSFQTASHFFLVMAYLPRGELFTFLRRRGTFPEDVAAFYSAEVTLAIEHLRLISVENFQVSHRKRTQARVQGNPSGLEA